MKRSGDLEDVLGEAGGRVAGWLVAMVILAALWLAFKAFELVVRVLLNHPHHRVLQGTLSVFLVSLLVAVLTAGQSEVANSLATLSLLVLLGTAKVIELQHDTRLQQEMNKDVLVDSVLTEPWFDLAA